MNKKNKRNNIRTQQFLLILCNPKNYSHEIQTKVSTDY